MLKQALWLLVVALPLLAVACSSHDAEPDLPAGTPVAQTAVPNAPLEDSAALPTVIIGEGRPPLLRGESVRSLMQGDAIVVGRVLSVALPYDPRPGYLGWTPRPCPFPPDHPKFVVCSWTPSPEELLRPPGRGFTDFAVEVVLSLGSSAPGPGETVFVRQAGGVWEGAAYGLQGDPLLEIGKTYLLSLTVNAKAAEENGNRGRGYSVDVPFSRFIVHSDGKLQPVDPVWASMPAVQELAGLTSDAALSRISAALTGQTATQ